MGQEKRFIIRQKQVEEENLNILCLQAFNLEPKNSRCHSPGRKIILSFTTKSGVPRQIKPRILELRIEESEAT